jgi:hypothetical protein
MVSMDRYGEGEPTCCRCREAAPAAVWVRRLALDWAVPVPILEAVTSYSG